MLRALELLDLGHARRAADESADVAGVLARYAPSPAAVRSAMAASVWRAAIGSGQGDAMQAAIRAVGLSLATLDQVRRDLGLPFDGAMSQPPGSQLAAWQQQLQTAGNIPSNLQGQYDQAVSDQQQNGVANGLNALAGLVKNGWPPDTTSQAQALLAIYQGALTAAGFPEIAAAITLLEQVAFAIAPVLEQLGILGPGGPPCSHSGPPVAMTDVLSTWGWTPAVAAAASPFARVAVPILASNAAATLNCSLGVLSSGDLLTSLVTLWNQGGIAPPAPVFVPQLLGSYGFDPSGQILAAQEYGQGASSPAVYAAVPYAFVAADPSSGNYPLPSDVAAADASVQSALAPGVGTVSVNEGPLSWTPSRQPVVPQPGPTTPGPSSSSSSSSAAPAILLTVAAVGVGGWFLLGRPTSWHALSSAWGALFR